MYFWKDKKGEKLSFKQFLKRLKEGVNGISPLQKTRTQITATRIQLLGIFLGLVMSIIGWRYLWWVGIILLGALINTVVQYLGLTQQRNTLVKHEAQCEEMTLDDLMNEEPKKKVKKTKKKGVKNNGF